MSTPQPPAPPSAGAPGGPSGAIVAALTASGGSESAGFLNDIIANLWPNISIVGRDMTKSIVEPMFASMLPSPLNSLHFVKIDLGKVPIKLGNVDTHKMASGAIKMDLDIDWDGECDIELDGKMIPKIGIEAIKLHGRMSMLLGPVINQIPLVGAAQVAFINPPYIKLKYTDVAAVANIGFIDRSINNVIQSILAGMMVLPNRFLVKLDAKNDWFSTFQSPLGILKVTAESASNLGAAKESKGFLGKLVHDEVDCFADVTLGAEKWRTKTINNNRHPEWNETHDYLLSDHDQVVTVEVVDDDHAGDDAIGKASVTVKELLMSGDSHEVSLKLDDKPTDGKVRIRGHFMALVADPASLSSQEEGTHGVVSVLIASAFNISGKREELKPSIKVVWGDSNFRTGIKADAPGSDVQNPSFDVAYNIPLSNKVTVRGAAPVRLILMDAEKERGSVDIPLDKVLNAPGMAVAEDYKLADGTVIRAAVVIRGTKSAH
ncbi:hypothetical protein CcaverHIS002_0310100 [Cutaneotrichosporon cavernicola]|uniref:C2 domain-containing protein n=1 Tax=Cutaneotrichosporon cavernicola TaxID=279322 RepID=A0AA48IAM9_9TREE|nr:uncharacterized protein CcaverHIS019_0309950 [Cutaneotrichosporon cavernicola]BEI83142.1 hypothetical protein CcaverHIS002_0310100 [Cutaneotrichosporon cavernicola]BEI90925.1 hypothetical protein CcaverHIS019_0309950 [Cutaneotrichosporon cavernicola]BEI98703.1 hypothetical protein CcaverHIS631_0310020 [Cutaneotrichosporon cavernicola]BEJ06473.1 hypothetical protein CcaverHIS641_0309950 [Cutaneotrichosporon cavernicola]